MSVKILFRELPERISLPGVHSEVKDPLKTTAPVDHPAPLVRIGVQPRGPHHEPAGRYIVVRPPKTPYAMLMPWPYPGQSRCVAISPQGKWLFVPNYDAYTDPSGRVSVFQMGADGNLSEVSGSPFPVTELPNDLAAAGGEVFLSDRAWGTNSGGVGMYSVSDSGALSALGYSSGVENNSQSVASTTDGIYVYNYSTYYNSAILTWRKNTSGVFGPHYQADSVTLNNPRAGQLVVSPDDAHLYFAVDSTIRQYAIDGDGAPTFFNSLDHSAAWLASLTFADNGYLYAPGDDGLHVMARDAATGSLSEINGSPFDAGVQLNAGSPSAATLVATTGGAEVISYSLSDNGVATRADAVALSFSGKVPIALLGHRVYLVMPGAVYGLILNNDDSFEKPPSFETLPTYQITPGVAISIQFDLALNDILAIPMTASWTAENLPPGMSISEAGVLEGEVPAKTLSVDGPSVVTVIEGEPVNIPALVSTNGVAPITWSVDTLPAGLSLAGHDRYAYVTGTPT